MYFTPPVEPNQIRALDIFLDSAVFENGYKPLSLAKIAEQLKNEGFDASSSSVGRWRILYHFDKRLELKISTIALKDEESDIKAKAITNSTKETIDRFKVNGELIDDIYTLVQCFINKVKEDVANNRFNREDIKILKDLLLLTTGREDKMLDRLANAPAETVSSEDILAQINSIDVDIEIEDAEIIEE